MSIIGCLDVPTGGSYRLDGVAVENMGESELAEIRGQKIGFVFQQFNLLARTSALENVMLPLNVRGHFWKRKKQPRPESPGARRAWRPDTSCSQRTFRRTATACGDCAGTGK